MSTSTCALIRVANATRRFHAQADGDRIALMDVSSVVEYRAFLERVYGFEGAVVMGAREIAGLDAALVRARVRLDRLREDLIALGAADPEIPRRAAVYIRTPAEALGWLFVTERHVLLSGLIRRFLGTQRPMLVSRASRYLNAETDGGTALRAFAEDLTTCVRDARAPLETIVAASSHAFQTQHHWYSRVSATRSAVRDSMLAQPRDAA